MCRFLIMLLMLSPVVSWAQDCNSHIYKTTPTEDFIDHNDGTVTHTKTGLMWMKCAWGTSGADCATGEAIKATWQDALKTPASINNGKGYAGYTDWRLANKNELISIVEHQCSAPAINLEAFPSTYPGEFWTSSNYASGNKFALYVEFYDGKNIYTHRYKSYRIRLVRGGE